MLQAPGFRLHVAWSLQLAAKTLDVYAALSMRSVADELQSRFLDTRIYLLQSTHMVAKALL
jgi:hypothetical protein